MARGDSDKVFYYFFSLSYFSNFLQSIGGETVIILFKILFLFLRLYALFALFIALRANIIQEYTIVTTLGYRMYWFFTRIFISHHVCRPEFRKFPDIYIYIKNYLLQYNLSSLFLFLAIIKLWILNMKSTYSVIVFSSKWIGIRLSLY